MKFIINGLMDFTFARGDDQKFLLKFISILEELNISFDGSINPTGDIRTRIKKDPDPNIERPVKITIDREERQDLDV